MIFPVRCFSCSKVIGNRWEEYRDLERSYREQQYPDPEAAALDHIGMKRNCCRRMFLCHVDAVDKLNRIKEISDRIQLRQTQERVEAAQKLLY